jgi:riboflavin synthase
VFAGLVEELATVAQVRPHPPGQRLVVQAAIVSQGTRIGDSIAINGCCLTVVELDGQRLAFDAGPETLQRTNLGSLQAGDCVNLERSLCVGDRLGGHFVTGHIDAVGQIDLCILDGDWATYWFRCPAELTRQMASKGSIAVDGISLTLVDVQRDRFSVALIPHTLRVTTLGRKHEGSVVNLETDLLAKYVQQQIDRSLPG